MKFNLSKIMKDAHALHAEGYTLSTALKVAWCQAKIDAITGSDEYFFLQMSDRHTTREEEKLMQYSIQIRELGYHIWECKQAETVIEMDRFGNLVKTTICAA